MRIVDAFTAGKPPAVSFEFFPPRSPEAEARLSYAALADLLSSLEEDAFRGLPDPQRRAIDAALLRADTRGERVNQRAVSAAVASLLLACAGRCPVVVAVDDGLGSFAPGGGSGFAGVTISYADFSLDS